MYFCEVFCSCFCMETWADHILGFSYWCESCTYFMCRSHQECVWCEMQTIWVIAQWVKSCANINTVHTHTAMVRSQQSCQVSPFENGIQSWNEHTVRAIYGFFNLAVMFIWATSYRLDGLGFEPWWGLDFPHPSRPDPASCAVATGSLPRE